MITWFIVKDMSHIKNTRDNECYDDRRICIWPSIKMRGITSETRGKDNVSGHNSWDFQFCGGSSFHKYATVDMLYNINKNFLSSFSVISQ